MLIAQQKLELATKEKHEKTGSGCCINLQLFRYLGN